MEKSFELRLNTSFGRDYVGEPGRARESYNFKTDGVTLFDGICLAHAEFGESGGRFEFPEDFILKGSYCGITNGRESVLVYGEGSDGLPALYAGDCSAPENGFTLLDGFFGSGELKFSPAYLYGNKVIAFTCGDGVMYIYDGVTLSQGACPAGVECLTWFDNRLAAITSDAVYLSGKETANVFSYEGSSVLDLPGELFARSVVVFGGELFIAGLRGCVRLGKNAYTDEYLERGVYTGCERFYPQTVACSADGVRLLTERGLAVFDGAGLSFYYPEIEGLIDCGIAGFTYKGEYLALVKAAQNTQKRIALVFGADGWYAADILVSSVSLRADGVNYMLSAEGKRGLYTLDGSVASPVPVKRYESCKTDFGISGKKVLKGLSAYTEKDVKIIIEVDSKKRLFRLVGGKGKRTLRPFIKGEIFSFAFITDASGVKISKITAVVGKGE